MYSFRTYTIILLAGIFSYLTSTAVAVPAGPVPKTKEHMGVGINLPKERADPDDLPLAKRGDERETYSPTGKGHADAEVISPFADTEF
ncbi:unnamed protein product [Somion occarium]|uniref:Uncharacterized protein n=1 Tax=Somion occarium TaxID=3059160 RepID=A0ABP1E3R1_9APHY